MAPAAAVRMTAVELTNSLAIDPAAAEWGVAEFAQALGYTIEPSSATLPQPDFTKQTAAQPRDQQFGATIAAPIPPYAGQPPPGYPAQQQFYAPPQPPADRTKSRGRLIIAASAVAVVVIGFFSYLGISPGPTPAQCLVGSWQAQSGYQTIASGSASGTWRITGGTEIWTYGPAGTGRVSDSGFAMTNHARSLVNELNDAGTFNYRVVGHEIEYHSVHVPGTLTQDNLATSKQHTYSYKTIYNDAPDQFSCSGSTLRRYGTAPGVIYSTTYKRQ
jgi:hypothetical protein